MPTDVIQNCLFNKIMSTVESLAWPTESPISTVMMQTEKLLTHTEIKAASSFCKRQLRVVLLVSTSDFLTYTSMIIKILLAQLSNNFPPLNSKTTQKRLHVEGVLPLN